MQNLISCGLAIGLGAVSLLAPMPADAEEVDLSCMSHRVVDKIQVAQRYKEYDVVVSNACIGPVYWSMCIERLDPQSQRVLEVHTPGGYVEAGSKTRVNLQMKQDVEQDLFRERFQEFYVNVAYAVDAPKRAACIAAECEADKRSLRSEFKANLGAWERAERDLQQRLAAECPETGWGKTEAVEQCQAAIRAAAEAELEQFATRDTELRVQIEAGELQRCRLQAGDLVPD
jgi:hypothetical protein